MLYHRIYAKINLSAIEHNIALIKSKIGEKKLMLVIKADAYGHGAPRLSRELEGVADYFAVADMGEALELRRSGISAPIIILGYTSPSLFPEAIKNDITLTLFQKDAFPALSRAACDAGKSAKVHIAVDTGMSRIGFDTSEISAGIIAHAMKLPRLYIEGIFTHLATADSVDKSYAEEQTERFDAFLACLAERGVNIPIKHISNSASLIAFPEKYDMVRAGIIVYGLYPSEEMENKYGAEFPLRPAMELISHISHIKEVEAGTGIGYGKTFVAKEKMLVATVPVGYADGYPRALSGVGEVLIHGRRCRILGKICMDQMMVDISNIPYAKVEDSVTLVGTNVIENISVEELADKAHSFNYEFICGIAKRVPRVYVREKDSV